MDGRGRVFDNILSAAVAHVKYEDIYLKELCHGGRLLLELE